MNTEKIPSTRRRLIGRFAFIASLALTVLAPISFAASGFSVSYTATQFKLFGQAHFERNPLCPDGYMIDQIGFGAANYATINVTVPTTGTYNISFQGETEYPRVMYVAVGTQSGPQASKSPLLCDGQSFKVPVEYSVGTIPLKAGSNKLVFFNATSGTRDRCPYISRVTISQ
jgi:hypothetical protein